MATLTAEQFAALLRSFDDRRVLVKAMRNALNSAAKKDVVPAIRKHALDILPKRGGLNAWVARSKVAIQIRYGSDRTAGIRLVGSRKSLRGTSDVDDIDKGKVRAPSWGHRGVGAWHTQTVPSGWFTQPASDSDSFRATVDVQVDKALDEIRG